MFDISFPFFVFLINIKGFDVCFNDGERSFEFVGGVCDKKFLLVVRIFNGFDDFLRSVVNDKESNNLNNGSNAE